MFQDGKWMIDKDTLFASLQFILAKYSFAAGYVKDKVVLDVACGAGYGSRYLFDKGAKTVVGGDISPEAIKAARTLYTLF